MPTFHRIVMQRKARISVSFCGICFCSPLLVSQEKFIVLCIVAPYSRGGGSEYMGRLEIFENLINGELEYFE